MEQIDEKEGKGKEAKQKNNLIFDKSVSSFQQIAKNNPKTISSNLRSSSSSFSASLTSSSNNTINTTKLKRSETDDENDVSHTKKKLKSNNSK